MCQNLNKEFRWLKPLSPRDTKQHHRAATPLELLFDLIFVVAIATAGQQLHHSIVESHFSHGLPLYFMVFFALWWAWMNFTWFASAYDNDDAIYRILTFIQIIGTLIIAAGIPSAFQQQNFDVIIVGYIIMRLSLVIQWFRAAKDDPPRRKTALRYAKGILALQVGWIGFHFINPQYASIFFIILVIAELCVPVYGEAASMTPWHPGHIAERYSLLTIIVLGESIVGCFYAMRDSVTTENLNTELIFLMIGGLIMMFTMWWAYFDHEISERLNTQKQAFIWGYGHYFIFISIAAIGALLAASVDVVTHKAEVSDVFVSYLVAISLVIYSGALWFLHEAHHLKGVKKWLQPITAVIVLCIPSIVEPIGYSIFFMAIAYAFRLMLSKNVFN